MTVGSQKHIWRQLKGGIPIQYQAKDSNSIAPNWGLHRYKMIKKFAIAFFISAIVVINIGTRLMPSTF